MIAGAARILLFFFAFTLEVRVKASEIAALPNSRQVIQEPTNCLLESSVCGVKTASGEKFKLSIGESVVVLDAQTAVVRLSENEVALLQGTIWVQAKTPLSVRTEFGVAKTLGHEFWVSRISDRMTVMATGGAVILEPRGSDESLRVDPGQQNWIGGVDWTGVAQSGIPHAIPLDQHLRQWSRLFSGHRREFVKAAKTFAESWARGLATVAAYHEDLANRRRSALQIEEEQRAQARARAEARSRELRQMFRRKVLLE